jgi:SagB-type dehydrogenase family enzyme
MSVEDLTDPLARFLDETRLRFDPQAVPVAPAPRYPAHPLAAVLSDVLGVGYGERGGPVFTRGRLSLRARTTPSAGARYPVEVLVAVRDPRGYRLHRYDTAANCVDAFANVPGTEMAALLAPGSGRTRPPVPPAVGPLPDAVIAVVGRPWLSMEKYGRRGYVYTHLDGGHATANLALAAAASGLRPTVRLRFDRRHAAAVLGLAGACREPLALVTCHAPADPRRTHAGTAHARPVWREEPGPSPEPPGPAEQEAWRGVMPVSAYRRGVLRDPCPGSVRSVEAPAGHEPGGPVPLADPDPALPFSEAALRRTSAKGFLSRPLTTATLAGTLAGLRHELPVDHADGPAPRLRLLVRDVDGIPAGSYAYDPDAHRLLPAGAAAPAADAVLASCQNQEVVRNAAALVAVHIPLRTLLGPAGQQALAEVHFRAATAAQHICLGAAATGLGATCLGGFDSARVGSLVALDADEEVLYVLALGVPDPAAVKWDRAAVAYSHGRGPHRRD